MSIVIACAQCGSTLLAPEAAAGRRIACRNCKNVIEVPVIPAAIPIADEPAPEEPATFETVGPGHRRSKPARTPTASSSFDKALDQIDENPWLWRGLGIGTFLAFCVIFGFIGCVANPDDPGIGASRTARTVGAPLALVLIGLVELGRWLWKSSRSPDR
jgi:hypothetical protein